MRRSIQKKLVEDLSEKIVLLSGPRQVGKTTLSNNIELGSKAYLNFDVSDDRQMIREQSWSREADLVIFDELHKMKNWKRWIKGVYDSEGIPPALLVTGSARMNAFRKAGDSLAGRHFDYRLHPFSLGELKDLNADQALNDMIQYGNFPEPFLKQSTTWSKRWRRSHIDRILREDLLDLENVRNIKLIEILVDLLAARVGSTISFSSLARDLEISPHTVKRYIEILESLYVIFIVRPYSKKLARSLLKEPKIYFYDIGRVTAGKGAVIENLVACHLLKRNHFLEDTLGEKMQLYYLRDKDKREIDFLTTKNTKLEWIVEVKTSDDTLSPHLKYFSNKLKPEASYQLVYELKKEKQLSGNKILKLSNWLAGLET